jgi:MFS family permease
MFRSLGGRNFRLFAIGQFVSKIGMWMQMVAIAILVLEVTDSGVAVGLVTAAQYLPVLLLSAWAGVWSDRCDRHRVLVGLNAYGGVVAAALAVLVLTDRITLWSIIPLAVLQGIFTALENPMRRVFIADLVTDDEVPNAVGLNSSLTTTSRVIGPAIAGALIAGPGIGWCFAVNAISFVPQIVLFARMDRSSLRPDQRVRRRPGQLREGLTYAWNDPTIRLTVTVVAAVGTLAYNFAVLLPLFAIRDLGGGPATYTSLYSFMSLGSIGGSLAFARRSRIDTRYLGGGSIALGVTMVALAAAPSAIAAYALVVPVGVTSVLVLSAANAILQTRAVPEMRGRVLALLSVVIIGSTAIGGPVSGGVAELSNARLALLLGAATCLVTGTLAARSPWSTTPASRADDPISPAAPDPPVLSSGG